MHSAEDDLNFLSNNFSAAPSLYQPDYPSYRPVSAYINQSAPLMSSDDTESSPPRPRTPARNDDTQHFPFGAFQTASPTLYHSSPRKDIAPFSKCPDRSLKFEIEDYCFDESPSRPPQHTTPYRATQDRATQDRELSPARRLRVPYSREPSPQLSVVRFLPFLQSDPAHLPREHHLYLHRIGA